MSARGAPSLPLVSRRGGSERLRPIYVANKDDLVKGLIPVQSHEEWNKDSWRDKPVLQQPDYPCEENVSSRSSRRPEARKRERGREREGGSASASGRARGPPVTRRPSRLRPPALHRPALAFQRIPRLLRLAIFFSSPLTRPPAHIFVFCFFSPACLAALA